MPTFKQQTAQSSFNGAAGPSVSLSAFSSNITTGNTIIVVVTYYAGENPYITDNLGNTYYLMVRNLTIGGGIYAAYNVIGGACTVTLTCSNPATGTMGFTTACAMEWSPLQNGIAGFCPYSLASTGTAATNGAFNTPANALVIGICGSDSTGSCTVVTGGSSFTAPTQIMSNTSATYELSDAEYQIFSSPQTGLNPAWTAPNNNWRCCAAVFIDAPASGSTGVKSYAFIG